jgi:LytR cell envelope-related transcriptional attenuator
LTVDVPERVEVVGDHGLVNVLWNAGPATVAPDDAVRFLSIKGDGNDLARLARQEAYWTAWLARLRSRPAALPKGDLSTALQGLAARVPSMDLLPVEAVDAGSGTELYRVRAADVEALVRRVVPGVVPLARSSRIRVQVLNGTGQVGVAQKVTLRLVAPPTRARVLYTGNADRFDHATTQVVFYDSRQRAAAERVRAALGTGQLVLSRRPLDIVDVTVVVGGDFR